MRFTVDGLDESGNLSAPGAAPFFVFDILIQDWIAPPYSNRPMAESACDKLNLDWSAAINRYRWHRSRGRNATAAIAAARADPTKGNYGPDLPSLTWQSGRPIGNLPFPKYQKTGLAYVEKPAAFGLRHVGDVDPEFRHNWNRRDATGWFTDPYGDSARDGTGLMWGTVYQLPGRHGVTRYVAGYVDGNCDSGLMVDLSTIYETDEGGPDSQEARDAARAADSMAQRAAETEREYQAAWQSGAQWAQAGADLSDIRDAIIQHISGRRDATAALQAAGMVPSVTWAGLCDLVKSRVRDLLDDRADLMKKRAALASGEDCAELSFYPDEAARAAFCDGAGIETFPR